MKIFCSKMGTPTPSSHMVPIISWNIPLKTLERIPNQRDEEYFYSYKNAEFTSIPWYQRLFNFIFRCLYFMTGPKFVIPILGIVQKQKKNSSESCWLAVRATFGMTHAAWVTWPRWSKARRDSTFSTDTHEIPKSWNISVLWAIDKL